MMLFAVLASETVPRDIAEIRQLSYLDAVAKVPSWAVAEAARAWRDGEHLAEGENRNFVPKPAELMRLVRLFLTPAERELDDTQRLLIAVDNADREPSEDERARVMKRIEALRTEMRREKPRWHDNPEAGLRARATANGVDFETAMAAIPDANPRSPP